MALVNKSLKQKYTRAIRQLTKDASRGTKQVVLLLPDLEESCPNCRYNRLDKSSANIYNPNFVAPVTVFPGTLSEQTISPILFNHGRCPVCYGKGKLLAPITKTIEALVTLNPNSPADDADFMDLPAGKAPNNFVLIKTTTDNYRLVYKARAAYIEGIYMEQFRPPIIRGVYGARSLCLGWFQAVENKDITTKY